MGQLTYEESPADPETAHIESGIKAMGALFDSLENASVPTGQTRGGLTLAKR